ncbi:hypothetical protein HOY82DRAFT_199331 [Tuber indicum]|nr:hypothetical protein HOY82DRAFT_199331 [Tuber indicum]
MVHCLHELSGGGPFRKSGGRLYAFKFCPNRSLTWCQLLARLCRIFLESSTLIKDIKRPKDSLPQDWDWRFWRGALLEQMEFRSSHEQRLEVLFNLRSDLVNRDGIYRPLCSVLIEDDTTEHRIESAAQMDVGACVSSLLAQYQTSLFLGYKDKWKLALRAVRTRIMDRWNAGFKYGSEMVSSVNRLMSETEAGDFPGRFCENIYKILSVLGRTKSFLDFYSASVISLYEELTLSLIFLVRPYEFLVPESWHRLYLHKWDGKYSSPSVLERSRYQQCLSRVCVSFCEMIRNIERGRTIEGSLTRRSVNLIVVCLINLGTFFPRPPGYAEFWRKAQEVFCCGGLNAGGIRKLREGELIGPLVKAFRDYGGNDSIRLVRSHQGRILSFAGFPLDRSGIFVVRGRHVEEEKKEYLWKTSMDQHKRELSAAHILTAFWKRSGRGFVRKMRERRRYFAPRYRNCCLMVDMKEDKNWMY